MAEDNNLLLALANIAGIFVGFGALISVTRRNEVTSSRIGQIRAVVTIGLMVIVASLIPVGLGRYGVNGHDLWAWCSIVFLVLNWVVMIMSLRRPENRILMSARTKSSPVMVAVFWLLLEVPMQVPLILTILGLYPDLEPAFYITSLVLNLFQAAFVLVQIVYSQANS